MDFGWSAEAQHLRTRLRTLIGEQLPPEFLGAFTADAADLALTQAFCHVLATEGLLAMAWPREYGGADASVWDQTVVREEMWAHHEPRGAQYMGVNWVGPMIMRHGSDRQRREHLPRICAGDVIWCQGFSEPDAGSDLASLRTAARRDGDGWVVNGQKVWTSYAQMAQWCVLLARTERLPRKQDGITVFLVPMDTPGIAVRPIASMVGPHHLNEVFFTDVRVDAHNVLGQPGNGWSIVREVLAFERVGIARYARCDRLLNWAPTALSAAWPTMPSTLLEAWASALVATRAARLLAYRAVAEQARGHVDPVGAAAYRITVTTLDQQVADLLMEMVSTAGPGIADERFRRAVEDHWRYAQAATVASGTIEIQKAVLGRALVSTA